MKGKKLTVHCPPFGTETIIIEELFPRDDIKGDYYRVVGTVTEGYEVSRLFQHTSVRDTKGERREYRAIPKYALEQGEYHTHSTL